MLEETKITKSFIKEMDKFREPDKSKGLIENCSDNIVVFAEYMLGFRLYSWQIKVLTTLQKAVEGNYWTREFVTMTSRQIGKTTFAEIFSLWVTLFNKVPTDDTRHYTHIGIISASDKQAKKVLRGVKSLMRLGDAYMNTKYDGQFGKEFFTSLLSEDDPNNTDTITFKSYNPEKHGCMLKDSVQGSIINSFPPTSVVLGETFTVLLVDEAGKTDKISDDFFDGELYPTTVAYDAIKIYTSTPWVLSGFFYRLIDPDNTKSKHDYERFVFTDAAIIDENSKQYATIQKAKEALIMDGKKAEAERAYSCRFVKGETNFFDPEKLKEVFDDQLFMQDKFEVECDLGLDFGGESSSQTIITISYLNNDNEIIRLYHKEYEVGQDNHIMSDIENLLTKFNIQRMIPDDCPQGAYIIRDMKKKGWNVQPMSFKADKIKKYTAFRARINRGLVRSYPDDKLKIEMNALENHEGIRSLQIRHAPGYSDDRIDSWIMSAYFFLEDSGGVKYWQWDEIDKNVHDKKKILSSQRGSIPGLQRIWG